MGVIGQVIYHRADHRYRARAGHPTWPTRRASGGRGRSPDRDRQDRSPPAQPHPAGRFSLPRSLRRCVFRVRQWRLPRRSGPGARPRRLGRFSGAACRGGRAGPVPRYRLRSVCRAVRRCAEGRGRDYLDPAWRRSAGDRRPSNARRRRKYPETWPVLQIDPARVRLSAGDPEGPVQVGGGASRPGR